MDMTNPCCGFRMRCVAPAVSVVAVRPGGLVAASCPKPVGGNGAGLGGGSPGGLDLECDEAKFR